MERPGNPEESDQIHPPIAQTKPYFSYFIPISILLVALTFAFIKSPYFPTLTSKPTLSTNPNPNSGPTLIQIRNPNAPYCVLWMAPFLSGGGYSSEAWSYITSLHENIQNPQFKLRIKHHGDLQSVEFWEGLTDSMRSLALGLHQTQCRLNETIVVCHSEPGAWNPPLFDTWPCPPSSRYRDYLAVIGRTMFETDRVNTEHVSRCNKMDLVWVPTDFHVSSFIQSGVHKSKVVKIVQPVDVQFFDPEKHSPLDLDSLGKLVLRNHGTSEFVFLSVFKWEYRKGWDVLLEAYLKEFTSADNVALYLLTNPYHTRGDFDNKIVSFVESSGMKRPEQGWARIYVIDSHISQVDLPRLYRSADVFVLPSRGEGWGRPIVEAMAMGLPVIATNWSGPTEFLREENSFGIAVERMSEVIDGPFKGHLWAEPCVDQVRILMRRVMNSPDEAKEKGRRAREDMVRRFSPEVVAEIVSSHIHDLLHGRISAISR